MSDKILFIGRLHISVKPAFDVSDDNKPILVLSITARGVPEKHSVHDVLAFIDKGREMIVRGFTSVTTPELHECWGRVK